MIKSLGLDEREETIRGRHSKDLFKRHWEKYWIDDLKVIHRGEPLLGIIEPYQPEGTDILTFVRTDKYPLRNNEGAICGVICKFQDITNIVKKVAEHREELNSQTLQFAQMSHELRGHLSGLPMVLDALEQIDISQLDSVNLQYISMARENASLTYQVVNHMLTEFTEYQTAQIQQFHFLSLVIDCTAILADNASNRLVTLSLQTTPDNEKIMISGSMTKFRSVILRLITLGIGIFVSSDIVLNIYSLEKMVRMDVMIQQIKSSPVERVHTDNYERFISLNAIIHDLGGNLTSYSLPEKGSYNCTLTLPLFHSIKDWI
jgi:signal transduction histidine kinase